MIPAIVTTSEQPAQLVCLPDPSVSSDLAFLKSEADSLVYAGLSAKGQADVEQWCLDMETIEAASRGGKGATIAKIARRRDLTENAVRTKYDRWKREGWKALINRSKCKPALAVPSATITFYRSLCHEHGREKVTASQAWRILLDRLNRWIREDHGLPGSPNAIPGYHTPPPRLRSTHLPAGWSKDTFVRRAPSRTERMLTAQGAKAYSAFIPSVHTTRVGIAPGQIVFFDDEQQDIYVNFMGSKNPMCRPLAFHALDCGSACNLLRNFKPMLTKDDGTKRQLTQSDFYWFTVAFLTRIGWREDTGTMLVGELGTAAWEEDFRRALINATGGKVSFDTSGRFGDPAFRGALFEGKTCGNSRYKAPIESGFNLIRNAFAALPGQVGRNRDEAPEETYGLKRYNDWCLKLVSTLPEDRAMQIRLGLLEWHQFTRLAHDIIEAINKREEHELEGWAENEFHATQLQFGEQIIRLTPRFIREATQEQVKAFQAMIQRGAGRIVPLSPREVWDGRDQRPFRKLRDWMVGAVMGVKHARTVRVTEKMMIVIEDQEIDPEPMRFIAQVTNADGLKHQLERGATYLAWLNPYDPDRIQIATATKGSEGKWLGTAEAMVRHQRGDTEALVRQFSAVRSATAGERQLIENEISGKLLARTADYRWNKRIADTSKPLTPGEKTAAARAEEIAITAPARPAAKKAKPILPDVFA